MASIGRLYCRFERYRATDGGHPTGFRVRGRIATRAFARHRYEEERMILHGDEIEDVAMPGGGSMRMHLFRPAGERRFPGILLYSEIYQVTAPIRRLAAMIAGNGYVVAVPEVYHEYEPAGTVLRYDAAGTDRGNALKIAKPVAAFDADAAAGVTALLANPACNGKIGTFGVCLGGHLAYRAALDARVSAAACFYPTDIHSGTLGAGRSDDSLMRMAELKAQAMFVWGRQDPHVPFAGRERIRSRLEEVGATYAWHELNAQHAFLRDEGPRYDPALFLQAMTLTLDFYRGALA
jgi:carboxymethylenebutenolidase